MFFPRHFRSYFRSKEALKLWVKLDPCLPTQVATKECINMNDFAQKVRQKLNIECQVGLSTSLENDFIRPQLEISEFIKTDEFMYNSDENPLTLQMTKIIYIADTDEDEKYMQYTFRNENDFKMILNFSNGLIHSSSPNRVLLHFDDIKDGEKYQYYIRGG